MIGRRAAPLEMDRNCGSNAAMTSTPRRHAPRLLRIIRVRARLFLSAAVALAAITVLFIVCGQWSATTKLLIGWDLGLALYLLLAGEMMMRADLGHIRSRAAMQDEGALALLVLPAAAAVASLAAIFAELVVAKSSDWRVLHIALAVLTITLSWTFIHTLFALHYAHDYYGQGQRANGLQFPGKDKPDYWDFAYFSFVIGMTFQVSDVQTRSSGMRRVVLVHGVISFLFSTVILALGVNLTASMF
jgi:uncharacterized membrane protein